MDWQARRAAAREAFVARHDAQLARDYEEQRGLGLITAEDEQACLADLERVIELQPGMAVLDVGAGTGALCQVLTRRPGLRISALEPSAAMLARLKARSELAAVVAVQGFCDGPDDRRHFGAAAFDLVISRQVANSLFDPLAAFRTWRHWLVPGGAVVVIDGLYDRRAWSKTFADMVDVLPLSCYRTRALLPYLLEQAGFAVEAVEWMDATKAAFPAGTPRHVVVARKTT